MCSTYIHSRYIRTLYAVSGVVPSPVLTCPFRNEVPHICLVGLVVKASAVRVEDLFSITACVGFFWIESYQ